MTKHLQGLLHDVSLVEVIAAFLQVMTCLLSSVDKDYVKNLFFVTMSDSVGTNATLLP